jgi:tRNA threonylcarbamoyladenosine biosynthesis protein TsaB
MTEAPRLQLILGVESAIEGGSLSLFRGDMEIGSCIGSAGVSRAEDLLVDINDLLRTNGLTPRDLRIVAASAGPGSFTGVRIGIATALGLARGSGARFASTSVLEACARAYLKEEHGSVAVPVGRGSVAVQSFALGPAGGSAVSAARILPRGDLRDALEANGNHPLLLHGSLLDAVEQTASVVIMDPNLARTIVLSAAADPKVTEPIFLSKN